MSKRGINPVSPVTSPPPKAPVLDSSAHRAKMTDDNFIVVPTRDEKKKQRKLEKQKPQFQFDVSWFRMGKKVGIAVSPPCYLLAFGCRR
jgi:hypothetical protein